MIFIYIALPNKIIMKTKVNGQSPLKQTEVESSKIDAIKDILFGENIQTYDKEFEYVKSDILEKKNELLDLISDVRKELDTAIDNLGTDLNIRITALEDKLEEKSLELDAKKIDKKTLGSLLIKLGDKISD